MVKMLFAAALCSGLVIAPLMAGAALPGKKAASGAGADAASNAASDPAAAFNPRSDPGDIELPMPNGLKMILRPVAIPAENPLLDKKFSMGLATTKEGRGGFYEMRRDAHVGASLRQKDLPEAWRQKLPGDEAEGYCYYFMGKYEISNAQWHAVMGNEDFSEGKGNLPKADISWYDVQAFLQKYNEWLLREHPESVPVTQGFPGFLRLPTEEEWEFAARGGNLPEEQNFESDFPVKDKMTVADFAVFTDPSVGSISEPRHIGSRNPNPLGLYDMGGNVAEMVQSSFHYTIADALPGGSVQRRLHGSEGGFIVKGGSFRGEEADVYPGMRVEARMFSGTKGEDGKTRYLPFKDRSIGARIVLSTINIPGPKKEKELEETEKILNEASGAGDSGMGGAPKQGHEETKPREAAAQGKKLADKDALVSIDPSGNPLKELDKIYAAAASPLMRSNLEQFRGLLKDVNAAMNRERDAALLENIRSNVYKADAFANIAFRFFEGQTRIDAMKENLPDYSKDKQAQLKKIIAQYQDINQQIFRSLEIATNYYRMGVKEIAQFPKASVNAKLLQLGKEYAGDDRLNVKFRKNIDMFSRHVDLVRTSGIGALSQMKVWEDSLKKAEIEAIAKQMEAGKKQRGRK